MSIQDEGEDYNQRLDRARDDVVESHYGNFTDCLETRSSTDMDGLRVGQLKINGDETMMKKFVYVPETFDFKIYQNMKYLLEVMGGISPDNVDNVFRFPTNYSVVPSKDKKTIEQWRKDFDNGIVESLFADNSNEIEMAKCSFADPKDDVDKKRIRRQKEDIRVLFSTISDFENTVFLMTNPFEGNVLSDLALSALQKASNTTVKSLGLFHSGSADVLDGRLTVLKEFGCRVMDDHDHSSRTRQDPGTPAFTGTQAPTSNHVVTPGSQQPGNISMISGSYNASSGSVTESRLDEFKKYERTVMREIEAERSKKEWMKFCAFEEQDSIKSKFITRIPIPDEIFKLYSVPYGEKPEKAIRIDCELTRGEEEFKKEHRGITWIPGGLASKCDHLLVFSSLDRMWEFEEQFCNLHPTGLFASGGSKREFEIANDALQNGKPIFAIEGTGFVSDVINHFFTQAASECAAGNHTSNRRNEDVKQLRKLVASKKKSRGYVDDLLYEGKLLEFVNCIKYKIFQVDEEGSNFRPFNSEATNEIFDPNKTVNIPIVNNKDLEYNFFSLLEDGSAEGGNDTDGQDAALYYSLKKEENADIFSNGQNNKTYYKLLRRKDSKKENKGWILIRVADGDITINGLKKVRRISRLVKNFMSYPHIELKIDELLTNADVPIIGVFEGSILQSNPKVREVFGDVKEENIFDMIKERLDSLPSNSAGELERFLQLDTQQNAIDSFAIRIKKKINLAGMDTGENNHHWSDDSGSLPFTIKRIVRRDRDTDEPCMGGYIIFEGEPIEPIRFPECPLPSNCRTLESGEVLLKSNSDAMSKFNGNAFHRIKHQDDTLAVKNVISRIMSTASDRISELDGEKRNNDAIDECLRMIEDAKVGRLRYFRNAIILQVSVQILIVLTTTLTVFIVHCRSDSGGVCKYIHVDAESVRDTADLDAVFSQVIIVLPIIAGALQTFIYCYRPKWKSARLLLVEKRLESELYKFRTRVGSYNAFDSQKRGSHDNIRKKFVDTLNGYVNECMNTGDIKSGTIYSSMKIYETHLAPRFQFMTSQRPPTLDRDLNAIITDRILSPQTSSRCCANRRRNRAVKQAQNMLKKVENKNQDIEAQIKGSHPDHLSDKEKDLIHDFKEATVRRTSLRRHEDYIKKHRILDIDDYKKERLQPQYEKFKHLLPRVTFHKNTLQVCIILFTSTGTVLGALSSDATQLNFLIPVSLAAAAFFDSMLKFLQLEARVPVLNQYCVNDLNMALREMNSPSTLRRRLPTEKARMVNRVEQSILSYYMFMAEDQLADGKQKDEANDAARDGKKPTVNQTANIVDSFGAGTNTTAPR